jgi:hypothetical protein
MIAALLFFSAPIKAATIAIDGDLTDLFTAQGSNIYAPYNSATGTDPVADAEQNGFEITDMYAYYDALDGTFYLGMQLDGSFGTSGGDEGLMDVFYFAPDPGAAGIFDANEHYGFNIIHTDSSTTLVDYTVVGNGNGYGYEVFTNPYGSTVNWAVNETDNTVEFGITGLGSVLEPYFISGPANVGINFFAGSVSHPGPEDTASLSMQVVPVPAAAWLFISGALGLLGLARRKVC